MATDLEQLVLTISADTRQISRALKRLEGDTASSATKVEEAFAKPGVQLDKLSQSMGRTRADTANLSAQFQDIAVQLAGGQSPFQIALQQGTQISQVLGQRGAAGVVGVLGGAFASLLNPVSLVTVGLIAAGGAAVQYLANLGGDVKTADDVLKEHEANIKALKDAYGDALDGLEAYASQSRDVIETQVQGSILSLGSQLQQQVDEALGELGNRAGSRGQNIFRVEEEFRPFEDAILRLRESARSGRPDIEGFRAAIVDIAQSSSDEEVLRQAAAILDLTKEADQSSRALSAAENAIEAVGRMANGNIEAVQAFAGAMKELSGIALPNLDDRTRAARAFQDAFAAAQGDAGQEAIALYEYEQALQRVAAEEQRVANERAKREAETAAKRSARSSVRDQERDAERVQSVIEGLQFEAEQLGRTNREQEIYNALKSAGVDATSAEGQQIMQLAGSLYDLSMAHQRANAAMEESKYLANDALSGFARDIRNGVSAADAFSNALDRIIDRLLDMAINGLVEAAFGGISGGGGGGIFGAIGSLFGFAKGTANTGGRRGEVRGVVHGQEAVIPLPQGGKVPVDLRLPDIPAAAAAAEAAQVTIAIVSGEMFEARVQSISGNVSAQVVKQNNRSTSARVAQDQRRFA